jgi:CBS domain containing-hemolysin-like protein
MTVEHRNLPHKPLSSGTLVTHNRQSSISSISLSDPATSIMTDFNHTRPFLTTAAATIDEINDKMIACGVRLLFVADSSEVLQGLVTYNDIFGEKPVRYMQEHGGTRSEILAQEIMAPLDKLEALQLEDILKANIGDIVESFKSAGRQHLLVVDDQADGLQIISGMFSSTQIEKQLGITIELSPRATTFAELEKALAG